MKTNIINNLAAIKRGLWHLTVSGLSLAAPLTVTAQNLTVSNSAVTISGTHYENINNNPALAVSGSNGTFAGTDITLTAVSSCYNGIANVSNRGTLNLTDSTITVPLTTAGVMAGGTSILSLNNVNIISTAGFQGVGVQGRTAATITIAGGHIHTTGTNSYAVDLGSLSEAELTNVRISTEGFTGYGLHISNASVVMTGGTISTAGDESFGAWIWNRSTGTLNNVSISTSGSASYGLLSQNSSVTVNGGTVATTGAGADAVRVGGTSHSAILNNTTVSAAGENAPGIAINGADKTVTVSGGSVSSARDAGIVLGRVTASDANILITNGASVSGETASLEVNGTSNVTVSVQAESSLNGDVTNSGSGNLSLNLNNSLLKGSLIGANHGITTVSASASNLTGNIITSGSSATVVNFNNSTLTGASSVSDDAVLTVSLDNDSAWNLTTQSSLTTLNNSGTVIIASALGEDLTVSGAYTQDADGTLDVTISGTGPIVNAGTASINGTLRVAGFVSGTVAAKASEIIAKNFTVIHTTDGIGGEFSTTDFGLAASTVDYVTLTVSKTNSDRDYALNYGLSWFAASNTSHGNFTIASGTSFEIDIVLSDTNAGAGAGGWDGKTLTKLGGGTLIVSSSNNFTGGATVESGTLRLSNLAGLGTGTVNVAQTILSVLDLSGTGEYKNDTTGAGTIILSANGVNISGNNSAFTGVWDVTGSGTMTLQNNLGVSGSTAVNIAQNGSLSLILGNGDYHFDQPLTGSGLLLIQNTGNLSLVPSVPLVAYVPAFTGTVELQHNTLALTADNALPLSLATLVTGTNNLVIVDSDPSATARNLGALSFSGGTIRFEGYDPHATRADTIIALSGTLSLSGGGTVEVVMPNPSQIPDGSKFTHIPLLQQDDGLALTLLISASNGVTGSPATLTLRDDSGNIISDSYTLNLSHDGVTTDAIGTYDYLLSTGSANDGLYVAFGLKQADIQAGRTLTLDQDTPTPAEGDDFTATLIGSGNLQINATNAITLNGTGNSYSGTTIVSTGTLIVGIDEQMFASSTAFVINNSAALNTNGYDQQVNNLSGSGLATFTNNTLTVNNTTDTSFTGTLSGGKLVKDGGAQLNASDAVAHLSQVQIDNGSLLLGNNATVSASGQPAVLANGGTATFNTSALSTSGSVLILAKDNAPATVNLNNMTVSVTGNFVEANNGALTVTLNDSTATGKTAVVGGGALNLGLNNSVWNLTGKSKLTTLTSSGGSITIDNVQGEDLVVTSGITGQTALNLTLSDSVKGNQEIWVVVDETNNMTGERFTLSHEVSYGMYNYELVNANDGAWLVYTGSSGTIPPVNPPPVNPPTISNEGDAIINTAAAVAGFWFTQLDNLHKRMGELRYNKPATDDALDNIWVRAYGQQINANTGITSVKGFSETQYGVDLGTDYLWKLDADNQLYTGVFAGYGGADRDFHTNYSGSTDSGYGGLYATWLNNSGWYADVVAKGQYFRNDFSGADRGDYDSLGLGFSVELGRQFEFKDGWFVEPSAQFSYLHLMNDNYTTRDGLHVTLSDADVLHIYGGARFGRNIKLSNSGLLQPYIKAGGLGQISSGNKLTVSGDHWRPNLDGARAVVGAGLIWQLDADSQLHLDYEASFGEKYDKPWGVNFGYRYQF